SCQTTIESSLFVHYRVIHAPQDVFALPSLPVPNRILCAHFARLKAYLAPSILTLALFLNASFAVGAIVGNTTIGTNTYPVGVVPLDVLGTPVTIPDKASVQVLRMYSFQSGGNVRLAVYDDTSPTRQLRWQSPWMVNIQTNGWISAIVSDGSETPTLMLGAGRYWLAFQSDTSNASYLSGSGQGFRFHFDTSPLPAEYAAADMSVTAGSWTEYLAYDSLPENNPPSKPSNLSPADGALNVQLNPQLQSSAFSDPDLPDDAQIAAQWQVRAQASPTDYSVTVFDSTTDTFNLSAIVLPVGRLNCLTTCCWRVRHADACNTWSLWSVETLFTTMSPAPYSPTNIQPADGATDIPLTPTLQASPFSHPTPGDTQSASQWQIRRASDPDDWSLTAYDSGTDVVHLTSMAIPDGFLLYGDTYYWRVRYQDNHGAWGGWSVPTSFSTFSGAVLTIIAQGSPDGVTITMSPADMNHHTNGSTPFTRVYIAGTTVTLTAPDPAPNGYHFQKWLLDGYDFSGIGQAQITCLMDTSHTAAAVYTAQPTNDNFADAIVISGTTGTAFGSNVGATVEAGEETHSGGIILYWPDPEASVWWRWTAPASGTYFFSANRSDICAEIAIYTGGNISSLNAIRLCNYGCYAGGAYFDAQKDVTYSIAVDGYRSFVADGGEPYFTDCWRGNIEIDWSIADPINISPDHAYVLTGLSGSTQANNVYGTNDFLWFEDRFYAYPDYITSHPEVGSCYEIWGGFMTVGAGVWWKWVAPATGFYSFDANGNAVFVCESSGLKLINRTKGNQAQLPIVAWCQQGVEYTLCCDNIVFYQEEYTCWDGAKVTGPGYLPLGIIRLSWNYIGLSLPELTVASWNPRSGVSITVSPTDYYGTGAGATQYSLYYIPNTVVTLTAPQTAGGGQFVKWQKDNADFSGNASLTVTCAMDTSHTMTVIYAYPLLNWLRQYLSGRIALTLDQKTALDINGDGRIDVSDLSALLRQ
ncbi:MAG: dockerin type I repeat-containing protein, partial [Candidatus Sumerlaeota bacterium]|nr:dockerin type I repeat-containing protein [Candidatus Sumerlaeota bacterium]